MITPSDYIASLKNRLTSKQASEYIGLSRKTLAQYRYKKIGPRYNKVFGRIYYTEQDIDDWLEEKGKYQ